MTTLHTERGFLVQVHDKHVGKGARWYANPAINALYHEQCDHLVDKRNWSWLGKTAEICARQFDATPRFLDFQLNANRPIPFRAVDFVMSTLEYLKTGRRRIAIDSWFDLLEVQPTVMTIVTDSIIRDAERDYGHLLKLSAPDLVCLWLQQPEGLDDLITSSMILFGDSNKVEGH